MNRTDTAMAEYLFHQGTNFHTYDYLGCHAMETAVGYIYTFRTWAPNAVAVSVVGDAFGWEQGLPLSRQSEGGIWETVYESGLSLAGGCYKFRITSRAGETLYKGDPYAFASRGGADGASCITHASQYVFRDGAWLERRRALFTPREETCYPAPLHIYELHMGSFARHADGRPFGYRELGDTLASYLKYMGYTHVELMPIAEHPFDGSWGYQICGYYAPTARFGEPDDFRYFVDRLHTAGIGVLMDWVPAHFPKDAWGLYEFDGQPLYEYQGYDRMESRGWGTRYFDVGREEVQSFLVSNALYWLREFHLDGLRVDAVAAMLYRDYDRAPGEWTPNSYGGHENLESIAFFRKLNTAIAEEFPDVLMIAEESTAFPGITSPVDEGGLGFSLKWNMGFANDFFAYLHEEPVFRRYHHRALTFPMLYAYSERYVLPISHDEVVYGKRSFLSKISGDRREQLETMRAALTFIMTFPGKKMTFMGTEFAQVNEWNHQHGIDFHLLQEEDHRDMREFVAALNQFYLATPALWEQDHDPAGFIWIDPDDADRNAVSYRRCAKNGDEIIAIVSFCGVDIYDYRLPVPSLGIYDVVFFSGTWGGAYESSFVAEEDAAGAYVMLRLPARTAILLAKRDGGVHLTL